MTLHPLSRPVGSSRYLRNTQIRGWLRPTLLPALLSLLLAACGGSSEGTGTSDGTPTEPGSPGNAQTPTETPTESPNSILFADEADFLASLPELVSTRTLADSGLRLAYTRTEQIDQIDTDFIESQWQFMQICVGQIAVAPLVVITAAAVEPFTNDDDVIYNIDGVPTASSSLTPIPTLQVRAADFDGSLGNRGFNFRSISGRYLWLSANLEERDYPFRCAQTRPEDQV